MSDPGHSTDPAGDEAARLARGKRAMEHAAADPDTASLMQSMEWRAGVTPDVAVDPFAPLTSMPALNDIPAPKKGAETWEPRFPAPGEPPEAGHIRHVKYGVATRRWVYRNATDEPLFAVARFEHTDADGRLQKETLPYAFGRKMWTTAKGISRDVTGWHFKRPGVPVPLYGLDRLAKALDKLVLVCEGEKSADAAPTHLPDTVAVTSQGGSGAAERGDWKPLAGRDVAIWPDRDAAGAAYAKEVAAELFKIGATSVRLVTVPDAWPEGWDLADNLPEGMSAETIRTMLDEAQVVPPPVSADEQDAPTSGMSDAEVESEIERLSWLPAQEYARTRKHAAHALGFGVGELDEFTKAKKRKRRAQEEARFREQAAPAAGEVRWPMGIVLENDGLYVDAGDDAAPTWLCDPIEVLGQGRDSGSEGWGLFLRWRDADRHIHTWPMPSKLTMVQPGELEAALVDRGLRINGETNAKQQLRRALTGVQCGARVIFADTPGWSAPGDGPAAFTLIDGTVIGEAAEHIVLKNPPENAALKMRTAGSLESWKTEIAAKAQGNPAAAFAICLALAGPLLEPLGESSGGFHFHGRSKAGKTLIMKMGLSVWGAPKKSGLLKDWRSTANALEGAAEECNDGFLPLDEVHQAEPREVVGAVYQLANESGKGRLTRDAIAKKRRTWRTMVMSTGEITIAQMAAKANQSLPAGAEVRLPSIPIDGQDMWPCLHGAETPHALMASLQHALIHSFGMPIREFLSRLTATLATEDGSLDAAAEMQRDAFYELLPAEADGQVRDVARRCALVALAGEMAVEWGILPWQLGEATQAASTIMGWWVGHRGGAGSTEESQHVRAVRGYLSEFRHSRFVLLTWEVNDHGSGRWIEHNPEARVISISGWRRVPSGEDAEEFLIDKDGWEKVCSAAGADPTEVAKTLKAAGHLVADKDGRNLMKQTRIPGRGKIRVYTVRGSIFAEAADSTPMEAAA